MSILEGLAEGKATAVNNAGVVPSVDDDHIVFADQGRYDSEVSLIPGSEEKGCLFLLELGQLGSGTVTPRIRSRIVPQRGWPPP
jgi:hypothetical protein